MATNKEVQYEEINLNKEPLSLFRVPLGNHLFKAKVADDYYWVKIQRTSICIIVNAGKWCTPRRGGAPIGFNEISTFMLKKTAAELTRNQVEFARELSMAQQIVAKNPDLFFNDLSKK